MIVRVLPPGVMIRLLNSLAIARKATAQKATVNMGAASLFILI
jgi:hypothetical protein